MADYKEAVANVFPKEQQDSKTFASECGKGFDHSKSKITDTFGTRFQDTVVRPMTTYTSGFIKTRPELKNN